MDKQSISADALAELLQQNGYSNDAINEAVSAYAKGKYTKPKVIIKPIGMKKSGKTVDVNGLSCEIKIINTADIKKLGPRVMYILKSIMADNDDDTDIKELLSNIKPMQALTSVIGAMMSLDGEADEWPEWAAAVLEEIAYLLDHKPKKGDDKQDIVPGHLVALTLDDLWLVIEEVVKVNKTPFLNITKKLPQDFILMISTLSSEIGKIFKEINSMVLETVTSTNFSGGVQNTGKSSTASQSRKKKGSPRKKSIA